MSRKVKKKKIQPQEVKAPEKKESAFASFVKKNKKTIIISAVSAVIIIAFVLGLVAVLIDQRKFDYMTSDLSPYIYISKEDYKSFDVTVADDEIDDSDVDRAIYKLLYDNKSEDPDYGGAYILNLPITVGDTAYLYYRGYTVDKDGKISELASGSNFSVEDIDETGLDIGSGSFIKGFEEGLIGHAPNARPGENFEILRSGTVEEGQVIFLSGNVFNPDGSKSSFTNKMIDLSSDDIDAEWGEGFKDYLLGNGAPADGGAVEKSSAKKLSIGTSLETSTFKKGTGTAVYFSMCVEYALKTSVEPITVETFFPIDYSEASLRGKTVMFDVYLIKSIVYDTPEYDEKFITDTLKITEKDLEGYSGSDIVEKHRAMVKAELEAELVDTRNTIIEEAMWTYYRKKANIKKLPKDEVNKQYAVYFNDLQDMFEYYSSSSSGMTIDSFARDYYGLSSSQDWREYITTMAKDVVTEKIIFYYIVREENIVPTDEELKKYYDELVADQLDYYTSDLYADELAKITDEKKKAERIEEIKAEMLDYYGESYFNQNAHYNFALEKLLGFAKVNNGAAVEK